MKKRGPKNIYKLIVTIIALLLISFILSVAPNYIKEEKNGQVNFIINNNDVTKSLKKPLIMEDNVIYVAKEDIENFFDGEIIYDSKYNQIITTSDTKVATLPIGEKTIGINSSKVTVYAGAINKDETYYLPFSEISKSVYNVETKYIPKTNTVVATSLDRKLVYATSTKNNNVKFKASIFSKTIDKIKKGENITVVKESQGWTTIATENGKIGYVKTKTLVNKKTIREDLEMEKQIPGKVSMIWDYFSEYGSAPNRTGKIQGVNVVSPTFITLTRLGKGAVEKNIGNAGIAYIKWAHDNGYKVWPSISNNSLKDTTSEIVNDYKLREKFINNILDIVVEYNFDGINLDFENIYMKDKDAYSQLIIELAPRLKELGKVLSVDVTAPDGDEDWSLCFNRNIIAKAADYIVFMAYDQNSGEKVGTVAGYDWVEANINKFLNREEVDKSKLIIGIPFYTKFWKESSNGSVTSDAIDMKDTYSKLPSDVSVKWLDAEKQNYAEYNKNGLTYKVWIEDTKSITEKLSLINKYNLAGAAYWEKDRENEEIWNVISESLGIK